MACSAPQHLGPQLAIQEAGGCSHLKAGPGLEGLLTWLTHVAGKSVLNIHRRPQFISTWASLCVVYCLHGWHLASSRVNNLWDQSRSCNAFLSPEATYYHFHNVPLATKIALIQPGRRVDRGVNTRKQVVLGTVLEAGYHRDRIKTLRS